MSVGDPDPYPNLAWMRSTVPIAEVPSAKGTAWFVTSYAHARTLLADPRLSNDARNLAEGAPPDQPDQLVVRDDQRLVGYVVPTGDFDETGLREKLSSTLPAFMMPSQLVPIDRQALPVPPAPDIAEDEVLTPDEKMLSQVFADVLGIERVGRLDDFFAIGGHSLLAARAMNRLKAVAGVRMSVRHLFEAPTVAELAGRLAKFRKP